MYVYGGCAGEPRFNQIKTITTTSTFTIAITTTAAAVTATSTTTRCVFVYTLFISPFVCVYELIQLLSVRLTWS